MTSSVDRGQPLRVTAEPLPIGTLAIAGVGVLLVSMAAFFRVSLLPSIGDSLSLSAAELGVLTMAFGVGRLVTDMPAGRFADRAAPGTAFALAGALAAGGSFALAAAQTGIESYAAAFTLGVGSSIANTTGMTVFSDVPHGRRGTAMAVFSACLLGGQSFGPVLAGAFSALGSWRTAETAAGVLGLGTVGLLLARGRPTRGRRDARSSAPSSHAAAEVIRLAERVVLYAVSFVVFFTLAAMPQTLVPIIGADAFGLSAGAIGLALGLGGICRFVGALSGGVVSDRIARKTALVPGLAINAGGIALLAIDGEVWLWVLGIVLMSLGSFGASVAATIIADRSRSGGVGQRLGRFRFYGDLGVIAGPAIAGALFAYVGRGAAVLVVAAFPAVLAVVAALVLTETRRMTSSSFELEG